MLRFGFFAGFRSFTGRERLAGVVAMLHDVLEDADEEALAPVASWLSDEEAEALRLLTRERGSYDEYVERIATAGNRIAVLVKRREGAGLWPQPLSGWQRPSDRFVRLPQFRCLLGRKSYCFHP